MSETIHETMARIRADKAAREARYVNPATYWIPDHGMTEEEALKADCGLYTNAPREIASKIAEDFHGQHDGWECSWPIVFHFRYNGQVYEAEMVREMVPDFYPSKLASLPPTPQEG